MSSPLLYGPNNTSNNLQNQVLLANGQLLSNNGPKNYIKNNSFENGLTTGWSVFTTTLTNKIPTGSITASAANMQILATNSSIYNLSGTTSLNLSKISGDCSSQGLISDAFTIDKEDQAKVLSFKFSYKAFLPSTFNMSGTSDNTWAVYIYDVTNAAWIQPAGVYNLVQSSGIGQATGTFQTSSNGTQYRLAILCINNYSGDGYPLTLDSFFVGPQVTSIAPAMSDWVSYTPTGSWTTNTTYTGQWKRNGDNMEVRVRVATSGTPTATGLTVTIPSGFTIDTTKMNSVVSNFSVVLGQATVNDSSTSGYKAYPVYSSTTSVLIAYQSAVSGLATAVSSSAPIAFASGDSVEIIFTVPIVGWSSNSVSSADTDTRVVSALFTKNGTQAVVSSAKIINLTTVADTHGAWDSTNNRYVIPVSGFYRISQQHSFSASTPGGITAFKINNGTTYYCGTVAATDRLGGSTLIPVQLKAGDYIEFYANPNNSVTLNAGATDTWFAIERLSGPAVVQASESVNVRYGLGSGQTPTSGGATVLNFETKTYDSHGAVTTGASWKFTAPVTGKYNVNSKILFSSASWTAGDVVTLLLRKNGVIYSALARFQMNATATIFNGLNGGDSISLVAGDYIDVQVDYSRTGGNLALQADTAQNYISINRQGN